MALGKGSKEFVMTDVVFVFSEEPEEEKLIGKCSF
jgi:hypothetical protein